MHTESKFSPNDDALTIFYDRSCSICRHEIEGLHQVSDENNLQIVDCSTQLFADKIAERDGIDRAQMMQALHIRDEHGSWFKGIDAFALLYRRLGLTGLASLWGSRRLRPLMQRSYALVARFRQPLRKSGLGKIYSSWVIRRARRLTER